MKLSSLFISFFCLLLAGIAIGQDTLHFKNDKWRFDKNDCSTFFADGRNSVIFKSVKEIRYTSNDTTLQHKKVDYAITTTFNKQGNIIRQIETDSLGKTIDNVYNEYDKRGRKIRAARYEIWNEAKTMTIEEEEIYKYDTLNNEILDSSMYAHVIDSAGNEHNYYGKWDVTKREFDDERNKTKETYMWGGDTTVTIYKYDYKNIETEEETFDKRTLIGDVHYLYNSMGTCIETRDVFSARYEYDGIDHGKIETVKDKYGNLIAEKITGDLNGKPYKKSIINRNVYVRDKILSDTETTVEEGNKSKMTSMRVVTHKYDSRGNCVLNEVKGNRRYYEDLREEFEFNLHNKVVKHVQYESCLDTASAVYVNTFYLDGVTIKQQVCTYLSRTNVSSYGKDARVLEYKWIETGTQTTQTIYEYEQ